jgi:hypothetical protein
VADRVTAGSNVRSALAVAISALLVLTGAVGCSASSGNGGGPSSATGNSSSSRPDFPSQSTGPPSTGPSTPGPVKSVETAATAPTLAQREDQLSAQTNGEARVVVRVPDGYEAAIYDQGGNIWFWHNAESVTSWKQVGSSSYPDVAQIGAPHASVKGALLHGMDHATFIVRGNFTGDGSGNAVAFADGSNGWGAIKAESSGNIGPSGKPVGSNQIGLSYDFGFHAGLLETKDCSTNVSIAECGSHPITKRWKWTGHDFKLT